MADMYSRSRASYEKSIYAKKKIAQDDSWLDSACFDAQQALEFLLKHILNMRGIPYQKTHDIQYLTDLLTESGFEFDKYDELNRLAVTITSWEEGSRYGSGVRTSEQTINRVYKIIDSINQAFLEEQEEINKE